jgi:hypothetical protein
LPKKINNNFCENKTSLIEHFLHFLLDRSRHNNAGNRNKKVATPGKPKTGRKCLNNVINQQIKRGPNKNRNITKVSNDNLMIDECGNVEDNNSNDDYDNEKVVVDFVDEWMHTFAFLSRES